MQEETKETQVKTVDIYPCKRSRRFLAFLGDFFLCFIVSVFLFEIVVRPSGYAIVDAKKIAYDSIKAEENNMSILYDNELLYYDTNLSDPDFELRENNSLNTSIKTSCDLFTKEIISNPSNNKFDVFKRYILDFKKGTIDDVISAYKEVGTTYFDIDEITKIVSMKDEYISLFSPKFDDKNEMTKQGEKEYKKYQEDFFLNFYAGTIILGIKENNLTCEIHPEYGNYLDNNKLIESGNKTMVNVGKIGTIISFLLANIILFIAVPVFNNKGRTVFEIVLKIERVDLRNVEYLKKRFVISQGFLNMLECTPMLCFIPVISYQFSSFMYMLDLFSIGVVGLLFIIIQCFLMCFTKMNQSLKEFSTHSICVDTDVMDNYYREQGYDF